MDSILIPRIWWFVVLFAFSQGALCDALISRTPCSVRGPEVFSLDACTYRCDSNDSVGQDLVQVYDYMSKQQNSSEAMYKQVLLNDTSGGQDQMGLANKMANQGLQYWWNSPDTMNSSLGQTVKNVEHTFDKQLILGSGNAGSGGAKPGSTAVESTSQKKQKIDIDVDAFQTQAKVKYEGYGNAQLVYQARDSSVALQMIETVGRSQDLIFGVRSSDQSSQVMYKYNW
jgi:hypothetical protein